MGRRRRNWRRQRPDNIWPALLLVCQPSAQLSVLRGPAGIGRTRPALWTLEGSRSSHRTGRDFGAANRDVLLGSERQLLLYCRRPVCRPTRSAHSYGVSGHGHVLEEPSIEDSDVHRIPASLVWHCDSTERPQTGKHKLPRGRPTLRAMGHEVAFITRDHVL